MGRWAGGWVARWVGGHMAKWLDGSGGVAGCMVRWVVWVVGG